MNRDRRGAPWRFAVAFVAVVIPLAVGFVWFAENLPPPTAEATETDAIVVLTGGSDRISTGLALLETGKGKRLFVSGVHHGVEIVDLLKIARASSGGGALDPSLAARIDLGHAAGDTVGNAMETAEWMRAHHFHTMRLVTADYHMRRAMIDFRIAAPDIEIWPNPVRPPNTEAGRWWRDRATFNLLLAEYGKYLIAKWRYVFARLLGNV
jgi:uncharacterized SAM-binding protein YcdF (DUF218 family)